MNENEKYFELRVFYIDYGYRLSKRKRAEKKERIIKSVLEHKIGKRVSILKIEDFYPGVWSITYLKDDE